MEDQQKGMSTVQTARPGPDFISIGMPASGTRWLYDNLQAHRDIHMPLIKELHFLDRGMREQSLRNRLEQIAQREKNNKPVDPRDRAFLECYTRCDVLSELRASEQEFLGGAKRDNYVETRFLPQDRHFEFYDSLFECYRPQKTGDITPGHWRLRPETIAAFHARYPDVRYLAMIRNPVQRTVSELNKLVHKSVLTLDDARRMIADPKNAIFTRRIWVIFNLFPSQVITKWRKVVGRDAILALTLDDVASKPGAMRAEIFAFLGLSTDPSKIDQGQTDNRKENLFPNLLSDVDTSKLREIFADEITHCQSMLGGATRNW